MSGGSRPFLAAAALFLGAALLISPSMARATLSQPVPLPEDRSVSPQLEIDGVGIGTLNYGNPLEGPAIDFSDSALGIGAAQRLYGEGIGSMGFGLITGGLPDPLFAHQAFLDYQTLSTEWIVGRTDNPSAHLVDFPTLREDNLLTFTSPLNPFSLGQDPLEHRYSNSASFVLNQQLTYFENIHVQHLLDSRGLGSMPAGLNSAGATFEYLTAPGSEALVRVPSFGAGIEHQWLAQPSPQGLSQLYAGGVLNLNESVTDRLDLRAQELVCFGSSLTRFQSLGDTFQASYNSLAASLRYLHSPFGKPGYQLALTAGTRQFLNVSQAGSFGLALTALKRLGEGFDLVGQYLLEWRDNALAAQYQGQQTENVAQVGLLMNFGTAINEHLSPRRSLLNFQHQYIPD